jgi:mRNA interferase RelE/StbE
VTYQVVKALRAPLDGLHSARRGVFRIVYRVDDGAVTVLIVSVDHRRDAYRR